jgi:hypothetical protein
MFGLKFTFIGNLVAGLFDGSRDEFMSFDNAQIQDAELSRNMLKECLPPSQWFTEKGYSKALYHLKRKDFDAAIKTLDLDTIGGESHICVWIFQHVILKIVTGCPKLLADSLPQTFY